MDPVSREFLMALSTAASPFACHISWFFSVVMPRLSVDCLTVAQALRYPHFTLSDPRLCLGPAVFAAGRQ